MQKQHLNDGEWTLKAVGDLEHAPDHLCERLRRGVPATVPGCVHTDLMANGLLDDPYIADNELHQQWIGRTDWVYTCRFTVEGNLLDHDRVDLACDGLDTIGQVRLNGREVGRSDNMHVAWRFGVREVVRAGINMLEIEFRAPRDYAEAQEKVYPDLPRAGGACGVHQPHNMMRKMSCNMGWDWGPDVATCGIWRPIRIEAWDVARIESVRPHVLEASERRAVVRVHVDVERAGTGPIHVAATLSTPDGETIDTVEEAVDMLVFEVNAPQRWWPIGHGAQPLYKLSLTLLDEHNVQLDARSHRIGLRTVALETEPDTQPFGDPIPPVLGESMVIRVNDKRIYCKGANWIPDDCFPHRVTLRRYRERIEQARDANMNMLRVWGGGVFEDDAFYDICDELGVMVWQDFLFACACYPEEEPYRTQVEREARQNVARLARHPSLVLWNGNNECIMGTYHWGEAWRAIRERGERTWGLGYYLDLLPQIVKELDPGRPYWAGSPYSGSMDRVPNASEFGNKHIWDVWHGAGQYRNYLSHYPRFTSEFGYHGPACYATVARVIPPDERHWNSRLMQLHNKNGSPGQLQTHTRMADDFDPPTDNYDDWHYLAQVMQARALSMGIEWFRALNPWNWGALFWQLNDCYPVSSWSAIDGDGRAKPLLHAARRFFTPRLLTIKPCRVVERLEEIGPLCVYAHNDTDAVWSGTCVVRQLGLDGELIARHSEAVSVAARGTARLDVPRPMLTRRDALLVADLDDTRGWWWFAADMELPYPVPGYDTELSATADGYALTVLARSLLRDVCVFPDRLDPEARVDDGMVTLLPGERVTFTIRTRKELTRESLSHPPVLRCVNAFGLSGGHGAATAAARSPETVCEKNP